MAARPNTPCGSRPELPPHIREQLENAFRALAKGEAEAEQAIELAVIAVGTEARERKFRPEELLVAFKAIEDHARECAPLAQEESYSFRTRIIGAMLEAYYR